MTTQEIEKALSNLEEKTLREVLRSLGSDSKGDRNKLCKNYQEQVLNIGVKNLILKLKPKTVKKILKALKLPEESEKDEKATLNDFATKVGIEGLMDKVDDELLKKFCKALGLEATKRDDMKKHIADEVMLTGMENLLHKLKQGLLQAHAAEMGLDTSGPRKALVERLMVDIFELEPLENEQEEPVEKKGKKGAQPTSKEKKKKKEKEPPKKKEKFVAPPLETIRKGKYDTYIDLYDNFNLPDLRAYCLKENLKVSGKKKEVINRILKYLKDGIVEEPNKRKNKKRKASGTKKSQPAKKQKSEESEK